MGEDKASNIMLVATEMATNLLKHGDGGNIAMNGFADSEGQGFELLAFDKGPGMADVTSCLADGFSTAGSPGTGLGAIERRSDRFAIYSRPAKGTIVMARFFQSAVRSAPAQIGVVSDPCPGEAVSGDRWGVATDGNLTLFVVDGSGHGLQAARAADVAMDAFHDNEHKDCVAIVEAAHRALAPTRGAALAVARIDRGERIVRFVGVGNIGAALVSGGHTKRMVSHNGTVGHVAPRIREFTYPFADPALLVMHSDGISARWELSDYPGLATSHAAAVAGVLFRDYRRSSDDALVVALRPTP
jgi:anti-sigma regulatory factor (Ser/Thr protein kinase)